MPGGKHESSLWPTDSATRLRADLRRRGQPDGRTLAPLLAAGLYLGRAEGPAAQGKAAVRGNRPLPRQERARRRPRPALRPPRHLARIGPGRRTSLPLLLSPLALP